MAKDIVSKKDVGRYGGRVKAEAGKEEKQIKKSSSSKEETLSSAEESVKKTYPGIKEKLKDIKKVDISLKNILIFIAIIALLVGFIYLDSKFYVIRKTPQEKAESAALKLVNQEIPKLLSAKSLQEAKKQGFSSEVLGSRLENDYWLVDIQFITRVRDLIRNKDVDIKHKITLKVDLLTYDVETPEKWT